MTEPPPPPPPPPRTMSQRDAASTPGYGRRPRAPASILHPQPRADSYNGSWTAPIRYKGTVAPAPPWAARSGLLRSLARLLAFAQAVLGLTTGAGLVAHGASFHSGLNRFDISAVGRIGVIDGVALIAFSGLAACAAIAAADNRRIAWRSLLVWEMIISVVTAVATVQLSVLAGIPDVVVFSAGASGVAFVPPPAALGIEVVILVGLVFGRGRP